MSRDIVLMFSFIGANCSLRISRIVMARVSVSVVILLRVVRCEDDMTDVPS